MPKFIFCTGGVMSGLGKGVAVASIAKLLQLAGFSVSSMKIDPYLNVDAGTMNPVIHGEVFVTDDGGETDMDLGTYERFLDVNLSKDHNLTTGQVYLQVVEGERRGDYLGRCVQIIPHVTDEIRRRIRKVATDSNIEILLVECGGTVGDIEGLPFLEALRQMRLEEGSTNTLFMHVTLAPEAEEGGEQKTKPTQHSVQELRRIGIQPDIILVRGKRPLDRDAKRKISLFTSVEETSVISDPDVNSVYSAPRVLESQGIVSEITRKLHLGPRTLEWGKWAQVEESFLRPMDDVDIAIVGKYVSLADSYVSVTHALLHAGAYNRAQVNVGWVDSEELNVEADAARLLSGYHGILIPGGFGSRGSEGKIIAANFSRVDKIPYLGLCFGFQLATVSFARSACGLAGANSTELDPNTPYPVIDLLPEQRHIDEKGATMRLGGHDIQVIDGTLAHRLYGKTIIRQRHRHRYEVNQKYIELFKRHGLTYSAFSDESKRAEILEISSHPFYVATQYHPEFVSRPGKPEPVFSAFIKASLERKKGLTASKAAHVEAITSKAHQLSVP